MYMSEFSKHILSARYVVVNVYVTWYFRVILESERQYGTMKTLWILLHHFNLCGCIISKFPLRSKELWFCDSMVNNRFALPSVGQICDQH